MLITQRIHQMTKRLQTKKKAQKSFIFLFLQTKLMFTGWGIMKGSTTIRVLVVFIVGSG